MTTSITRRAALAGAAALSVLPLASLRAESKGRVVYFAPVLFDEFQTEALKGIETVFRQMGYEVTSLDAQNDSARQLSQIEDQINTKPDLMIIAAVAFDAVVPAVEKARAAGIKVMQFDRSVRQTVSDLTSVAGTVEIGQNAAGEIIRLLKERHGAPKGTVLQILGDPGDTYTLDIQQGFEDRIKAEAPDVQVITKAAMAWEATNAGKIFEDQLLVNPNIDLVFTHSSHLTVPIVSIMEAKGMKPGQMMLVSATGMPVGLDNIRKGWQQAEIEQPTYAQVIGLAMFAPKVLRGEKLQPGTYDVMGLPAVLTDEAWGPNLKIPGGVITKENVDDPRFWGNLKFPTDPVKVVP